MLPNFLVIGAPKCGTSTLCHLLDKHPDVFMSEPKEIHYFGRSEPEKTRDWYEAYFQAADGYTAVGEGSTSYTHPDIIDRCVQEIADQIPQARLIYIIRHPIRRLESDWKMRKREGWAPGSISEEALRQATLISHGLYWHNISRYRERFPDDQILIVFLEDMARHPARVLRRCFEHIGVSPSFPIENRNVKRNSATSYRRETAVARWIRKTGVLPALRKVVPQTLISAAGRLVMRPSPTVSAEWDPQIRGQVVYELAGDAKRILEFCGKPADFWTFE